MHDYRYIHHVHVLDLFLHHHRLTISKQSWPCSIHFTLLSISAYTKGFFTSERPSTSTIIEFQFLSIHFLPSLFSKPVSPWNLISCWVITIFSDLSLYAPKIKGLEINLSCVYHKKSNMMLSCLSDVFPSIPISLGKNHHLRLYILSPIFSIPSPPGPHYIAFYLLDFSSQL